MKHLRVLIDESGGVVDLIVDHQENILLGVVLRNLGESKFLGHDCLKKC